MKERYAQTEEGTPLPTVPLTQDIVMDAPFTDAPIIEAVTDQEQQRAVSDHHTTVNEEESSTDHSIRRSDNIAGESLEVDHNIPRQSLRQRRQPTWMRDFDCQVNYATLESEKKRSDIHKFSSLTPANYPFHYTKTF